MHVARVVGTSGLDLGCETEANKTLCWGIIRLGSRVFIPLKQLLSVLICSWKDTAGVHRDACALLTSSRKAEEGRHVKLQCMYVTASHWGDPTYANTMGMYGTLIEFN